MNLAEFKKEVDRLVKYANECEEPLEDIEVSMQLEDPDGEIIFTNKVELHYDNNCQASGFVILGDILQNLIIKLEEKSDENC